MKFRYIEYKDNKLYKNYPREHELKTLTSDNLRIMLASARYHIRIAKKKCDYKLIRNINTEVEELYHKYSVKNKTSIKFYEAFVVFIEKLI